MRELRAGVSDGVFAARGRQGRAAGAAAVHRVRALRGRLPESGKIKVCKFVRFEKGEGIEKKVDDFAAEVAAAAGLTK